MKTALLGPAIPSIPITGGSVSVSIGGGDSITLQEFYDLVTSGTILALDDLTDVVITSPTLDDDLRFNGSMWVNDDRKWEAVTGGEDIFVWDGDDLVHDWSV